MSPASSFPGLESALIVPALELAPLVESYRQCYDLSAPAGIPPHVTVMYPFLDPNRLTDKVIADLDRLLSNMRAFAYSLVEVREFEGGVLYLAPDPAEPFVSVTQAVAEAFGVKPYGGVYARVVPHLTVAQTADEHERRQIGEAIAHSLPREGLASEAWLVVGSNQTAWTRRRSFSFGG